MPLYSSKYNYGQYFNHHRGLVFALVSWTSLYKGVWNTYFSGIFFLTILHCTDIGTHSCDPDTCLYDDKGWAYTGQHLVHTRIKAFHMISVEANFTKKMIEVGMNLIVSIVTNAIIRCSITKYGLINKLAPFLH